MKLTDGQKTIDIQMREWDDYLGQYGEDFSSDIFTPDIPNIYVIGADGVAVTDDLNACVQLAYEWELGLDNFANEKEWDDELGEYISPDFSVREATVNGVPVKQMMHLIQLQKYPFIDGYRAIVDASQNLDKYSPEFFEIFFNKDTGKCWAIYQVSLGHRAYTKYTNPAIIKIANLVEPITILELIAAINRRLELDRNKPLMQRLIDAGYADKINHHDSDLYVEVTAGTDKIIKDWMRDNGYRTDKAGMEHWAPTFRDNITGKLTFDVPFQYIPYFEEKARIQPEPSLDDDEPER